MGGSSMNCNTMEEEIYWKFFKTVQFSQTLSAHFHHKLEVPKRFVKNLREKLGTEVCLKGPGGAIWKVGLVTETDSLYFDMGWKQFIKDNSLEENDRLIFKYNGSSNFDVLMFDGKSLCEKEASYFVRKCTHSDMERKSRRGIDETSEKISDEVLHGRQSNRNEDAKQVEERFHAESASEDDNSMEWTPLNKCKKADSARQCATENRRIHKRKSTVEVLPTPHEFKSNRRLVTKEEKANAEQRANAEASDESLVLVMRDYHVYYRFYLTLPAWWSNTHLPPKNQTVNLQLEGKAWPIRFIRKASGGMLISGWKKFVVENSVEEDDACLFNKVSPESDPIDMDVKIFRVVEEVVPPTPLLPQSSGKRGRPRSSSQRGCKRGMKVC